MNALIVDNALCQHPDNIRATYTLRVANRSDSLNKFEADVMMKWTNYPGSGATHEVPDYEYAGGQYFYDVDSSIRAGGVVTMSNAGSDLPLNMQPRNPTVFFDAATGKLQLRWAVNTFPGPGNGYLMPAGGVERKIMRIRLRTSLSQFPSVSLNLVWRNALPGPFTKIFQYSLSNPNPNQEISSPQTHTIDIQNYPLGNSAYLNANFYSNKRELFAGQSVNFSDSTYGTEQPNQWTWTFEGGTPSTSNVKNPTNIRYDIPGVYYVSLHVSSPSFSSYIAKAGYVSVYEGCYTVWSNMIQLRDAGNARDSLEIGTSAYATSGIDTCLNEFPIPPPPPAGIFDCRLILPSNDAVKTDIRKDSLTDLTWRMTFQPSSSGYPVTLSWNSSLLPSTGSFFLRDEITGTIVNIDMRAQSSYVLTNSGINSLKIVYLHYKNVIASVNPQWNIVSVPLRTNDMLYLSLFPGVASQAYAYSAGYVSVSMLSNGTGYWMRFNNSANYTFSGYNWNPEQMIVSPGWNLVGPFDKDIPVSLILSSPPGIVNSSYYGYNAGYFIPDTLKVGKGYWIRTSSAGYLYKASGDNVEFISAEDDLKNFTELKFNSSGSEQSLYLADPRMINADYAMPPVPPSGIFDARFGSDTYVESTGKVNTLKLSSNDGQIKLSVHNAKGLTLRIKDAIDGTILNSELTEGTEITIPAGLSSVLVESGSIIPLTYELSQNYPNPFNPSTKIKYQIPKDGHVKIAVYDVLGKEVNVLTDGFRVAGSYEARFDASSYSSGVYFYKMTSGDFIEIRKMVVMK